jgi:DNA-binding transcriptional regulator YiaG
MMSRLPGLLTGTEFKSALRSLGLRQVDFASRFGLSGSTVYHWASDVTPVPVWVPGVLELLRTEPDNELNAVARYASRRPEGRSP